MSYKNTGIVRYAIVRWTNVLFVLFHYFENLDGYGMQAPLNLMHGTPAGSGNLGGADGLPSTNCEVVHNTWGNCRELRIGYDSSKRPLLPKDCTFANNIIYGNHDNRPLLSLFEAVGVAFRGNIIYPTGGATTGFEDKDFTDIAFAKIVLFPSILVTDCLLNR